LVDDFTENFRGKTWDTFKMNIFSIRQCVPNPKVTRIKQSYNISGKSFINYFLFLGHKRGDIRKSQRLCPPYMVIGFVSFKFARTNPEKGNPVPVVGIH